MATATAPSLPEHGTYARYQRQCRCPDCRKANKDRGQQWRSSKSGLPEGDPRHGTANGYINYNCRCEACRAANRLSRHCPGCRCKTRATAREALSRALRT